jgi:hypothetical protein
VVTGKAIAKGKMTNDQAKQILQLYRPGTADAVDPEFAEALEACERNAELKEWFGNHCAVYAALRSKFKKVPVPEGFKEQIIAERQVHVAPLWQKAVILAGAMAAIVMVISGMNRWSRPSEPHDFAAYRAHMGSVARTAYGMDRNTSDLDEIRLYFAQNNAIADYVLPADLQKNAKATGCVATSWQGKNVSMICFQSGRPLAPNQQSDLWLFISERTVATDAPVASTPAFANSNGLVTASWTVGNRTYVLATEGDKQFLGKFVPQNVL